DLRRQAPHSEGSHVQNADAHGQQKKARDHHQQDPSARLLFFGHATSHFQNDATKRSSGDANEPTAAPIAPVGTYYHATRGACLPGYSDGASKPAPSGLEQSRQRRNDSASHGTWDWTEASFSRTMTPPTHDNPVALHEELAMPITVTCTCGATVRAKDEWAGR